MSKPANNTLTAVAMLWQDATFAYKAEMLLQPMPILTFGIEVDRCKEYVTLASEVHADAETLQYTTIPLQGGMAPKIITLKRLVLPPSFVKYRKAAGLA